MWRFLPSFDSLSFFFYLYAFRKMSVRCISFVKVRHIGVQCSFNFRLCSNFDNRIRFARHIFDSTERQTEPNLGFRLKIFNRTAIITDFPSQCATLTHVSCLEKYDENASENCGSQHTHRRNTERKIHADQKQINSKFGVVFWLEMALHVGGRSTIKASFILLRFFALYPTPSRRRLKCTKSTLTSHDLLLTIRAELSRTRGATAAEAVRSNERTMQCLNLKSFFLARSQTWQNE